MEHNLKEMSLTELQALGYRLIAQKEHVERQLQIVNQEITLRIQKEQVNGVEHDK